MLECPRRRELMLSSDLVLWLDPSAGILDLSTATIVLCAASGEGVALGVLCDEDLRSGEGLSWLLPFSTVGC